MKLKNGSSVQQDNILYVGVSEQIAKMSPTKGLQPPVILTNVYAPFLCLKNLKDEPAGRWGIISVRLDKLSREMLTPCQAYMKKYKKDNKGWEKSLQLYGTCIYPVEIKPYAIERVMIYDPIGRDSNKIINDLVSKQNPNKDHKANYVKNLAITKWLNGEEINCDDLCENMTQKAKVEIEEMLYQRSALDVYYIRPEDKVRKGKHAAKATVED